MPMMLSAYFIAAITHGGVVPLLWVIGVIVLVAGVISLVRGSILVGAALIVIGILLGGLNVF